MRTRALANLAAILVKGHIADMVEPVFDLPVSTDDLKQCAGRRLFRLQVCDSVNDFVSGRSPIQLPSRSFDLENLLTMRKIHRGKFT